MIFTLLISVLLIIAFIKYLQYKLAVMALAKYMVDHDIPTPSNEEKSTNIAYVITNTIRTAFGLKPR